MSAEQSEDVRSGGNPHSATSNTPALTLDESLIEAIKQLGSPTVRPPRLEKLTSLDRESLTDFVIRFKRARNRNPLMEINEWLSGTVFLNIRAHGVNPDDTLATLKHLENILKIQNDTF
eukprot:augustus_masked-scaffold_2-processed-gene-27.9-mRNA-1 protein AED:1.00 eAED:1.00 QI:0/-1/0/0/-1/1/1/0/118